MIKFLIKKSFFDAWDNILSLILINLGFIICLAITLLLPGAAGAGSFTLSALLFIPGMLISHIYAGTASVLMYEISDFRSISFRQIKTGFIKTWKASIVIAVLSSVMIIALTFGLPFYSSMGSILGIAGAGILLWVSLFWLLSCQYFFPVFIRMEGGILKSLKKSFLICLDNPFYSLFILIQTIIIIAASIITVMLLPGFSAVLLLHQDALKLRLYKYDWLENNPDSGRAKIPWDKLLKEDDEKVGHRSLRGMIFPWKD